MCCNGAGGRGRAAVFAGTTEGRLIAEFAVREGIEGRMDFLVATEYGREILEGEGRLKIHEGRLDRDGMKEFFKENGITLVIDATHPYAAQVTENIRKACEALNIKYVRLLRPEEEREYSENIVFVKDTSEAADFVKKLGVKTLVTTGSKEIGLFGGWERTGEMIVARVLPSETSIKACLDAGIAPKNIIGMQGPFTLEMNLATLRQYGCGALVTKDTGSAGGFPDKTKCADEGFKVIVIRRPVFEAGVGVSEAEEIIKTHLHGKEEY